MMVLSDMPQTTKGSWFLHYEQKMDAELIDTIKGTIYKIWQTKERIASLKAAHQVVPSYLPSYLKWLDQSLNKMRSVAVYYKEYSTLENLQLLGEEYIRQMKRDLTPKTFQTSILCQKIGISHDGFYSSMQEWHKYDASDFGYLDSLGYDRIFNRQNNDDLILAIQSAGVERGRNGFRKNKSMEKNPESEEDLLQHRTDGTDAFDTLYIGCEKFPQHDFYGGFVGGVR